VFIQDPQRQGFLVGGLASVFQALQHVFLRPSGKPSLTQLNMYNFHKVRGDKSDF
jgi:hypothetical protein